MAGSTQATLPAPARFAGDRAARWAAVLAGLLTVAVRLAYSASQHSTFNADEAADGVMVQRILRGHSYTFFAGQNYGGTVEEYLQAGMYWLFRLPQTPVTLRLPLIALDALTCGLVYLCARRMLAGRSSGALTAACAALLYACLPWNNIVAGITALGFYPVSQLFGIAGVYAALRLAGTRSPPAAAAWTAGLGLGCGLAYWNSLISAYLLVPAVLWSLPRLLRSATLCLALAGGAIAGAAPVLAWAARHGRLPVPRTLHPPSTPQQRLAHLAGPILREHLGLATTARVGVWGWADLAYWSVLSALVAGYLVAAWRARGRLRALARGREQQQASGTDLVLLMVPVVIVLYVSQPDAWIVRNPRYLFSTYPLLAIGVAVLGASIRPRWGRLVLLPALSVAMLAVTYQSLTGPPSIQVRDHRDRNLVAATGFLVGQREPFAYSCYWTATALQFYAGDRIAVATALGPERFPQAAAAVSAAASYAYVLNDDEGDDQRIRRRLDAHGVRYRLTHFGRVAVLDQLSVPLRPADLGTEVREPL